MAPMGRHLSRRALLSGMAGSAAAAILAACGGSCDRHTGRDHRSNQGGGEHTRDRCGDQWHRRLPPQPRLPPQRLS